MTLRNINPDEVKEYIPECEKGVKDPTIFGLKPITSAQSSDYTAGIFNAQYTIGLGRNQKTFYSGEKLEENNVKHFCNIVKYIKNFIFDDGKEKQDVRKLIEDKNDIRRVAHELDSSIRDEVLNAARDLFTLNEVEKKS